jgi:hypothetical protein
MYTRGDPSVGPSKAELETPYLLQSDYFVHLHCNCDDSTRTTCR